MNNSVLRLIGDRVPHIFLASMLLGSHLIADEPAATAQQLTAIEIELRQLHYRQASNETLELRKRLLNPGSQGETTPREPELLQKLQRLELWKAQLRNELAELDPPARQVASRPAAGTALPSGHYLVMLRRSLKGGTDLTLNFRADGDRLHCVNSSDPALIGLEGRLDPAGNGAFRVRLEKGDFLETQLWAPGVAGKFQVLESPDRGENQLAIPVPDDRLRVESTN